MSRQKSIFSKYFVICVVCVTASVLALGVILLAFSLQHFKDEKFSALNKNAYNAASLTAANYASHSFEYLDYNTILNGYKLLSMASDSQIFFTDLNGKTLVCSDAGSCVHTTYTVSADIIKEACSESYSEMGNLGGMYKTAYCTVSVPVVINGDEPIGVVFVSTSADSLAGLVRKMSRIVTVTALVTLLVSFVLVYAVTARLVRPLRQMVAATRSFSKGDFTQRIAVSDENEIGELAQAFNSMAGDLAQLESTSRSFVANVSHELKTPMTTIIGFVEGIIDGTIPPEQHERYLKIVLDEAKRLSVVVRSMLDIARIEAGEMKLSLKAFDINEVVCQALFPFEKKIEEKRLDVRGLLTDERIMVEADEDLIHQVVYNLIDNAVKFANENGYIEFRYTVEKSTVYISVINSGEGISEDECKHIFDRFYKTDKSRSRDKQGVGLGLHIVKSIIKLSNGDIIVRSRPNSDTEFTFTLPSAGGKNKKL